MANFTVTFDPNTGTGAMTPQVAGAPTALTTNTFTKTGSTFTGWNTVADGSGTAYADGATYAFGASVTLYAQWTVNLIVTFHKNGGTGGSPTTQASIVAAALTSNPFHANPATPTYVFRSWNTKRDGSGAGFADGATYSFAANMTLYAIWGPNESYSSSTAQPPVSPYPVFYDSLGTYNNGTPTKVYFNGTTYVVVS